MKTHKTKKYLKLVPLSALILSVMLTGKSFADEASGFYADTQSNQQLQRLINWNNKVQAILSTKLQNNLKLEMQGFASKQPAESLIASQSQQIDNIKRDLVLISANKSGAGVTARSTTPVIVIIDRKELCLLNL